MPALTPRLAAVLSRTASGPSTSVFKVYSNIEVDGNSHAGQAFDTTGAVAGDVLVMHFSVNHTTDDVAAAGAPTVDGSGIALTEVATDVWAANSGVTAGRSHLLYKVLTSADISTGTISIPYYGGFDAFHYACAIFHGGSTVTRKDFQTSSTGTSTQLVFNGYAQSGGASVVMTGTRINQGSGGTMAPPPPFTDYQDTQASGTGVTSNWTDYVASADANNLSATTYTFDGYNSVSPSSGGHAGQAGYLFQIS